MSNPRKQMYVKLAKDLTISLLSVCILIAIFLWLLHSYFKLPLALSDPALKLGIVGSVLVFIGNALVSDAVTRYDAPGMPQWRWGNRIQAVGFSLTIVALLLK